MSLGKIVGLALALIMASACLIFTMEVLMNGGSLTVPFLGLGGDSIDEALVQIAEELNAKAPITLDAYTRMDSVTALPNGVFIYYFTLTGITPGSFEQGKLESQLKQHILRASKNMDEIQRLRMFDLAITFFVFYDDGSTAADVVIHSNEF